MHCWISGKGTVCGQVLGDPSLPTRTIPLSTPNLRPLTFSFLRHRDFGGRDDVRPEGLRSSDCARKHEDVAFAWKPCLGGYQCPVNFTLEIPNLQSASTGVHVQLRSALRPHRDSSPKRRYRQVVA